MLNGSPHKKRTGKTPHVPLVSRWGAMKVSDITRRDVRDLLDDVAERAPIMANRVLALVRKMFNFAIEHDWLDDNPCQMIKRVAPERQRERVLSEDEIPRRLERSRRRESDDRGAVPIPSADRPAWRRSSRRDDGTRST